MEDKYSRSGEINSVVTACTDDDGEELDDQQEVLKRRISDHPLYGLLRENHINCLKVGLGEIGEIGVIRCTPATENANTKLKAAAAISPTSSELDQFMEAYCNALNKLKEAMEDPLKDTTSFITAMYAQLEELTASKKPH